MGAEITIEGTKQRFVGASLTAVKVLSLRQTSRISDASKDVPPKAGKPSELFSTAARVTTLQECPDQCDCYSASKQCLVYVE